MDWAREIASDAATHRCLGYLCLLGRPVALVDARPRLGRPTKTAPANLHGHSATPLLPQRPNKQTPRVDHSGKNRVGDLKHVIFLFFVFC
eukprot:4442838-Pyramimonas_sp.AAC.1